MRGRLARVRGVGEERHPDQPEALDEVGLGHVARPTALVDLVDSFDLRGRERPAQRLLVVVEHAQVGAERVDAENAGDPLGVSDGQMQGEVATPRVADHPGALEPEPVEHGERVRHVRLDRVRPRGLRGRRAALRVANRREEPVELLGEVAEVVGNRRTSVEQERGPSLAAAMAAKDAAVDG